MVVVGLTGGIGAGKSTLAALLAERGAAVIDVDAIGRDVISGDGPGAEAVLARFGTLDRREIAAVVFNDEPARRDLESISWPLIEDELRRRIAGLDGPLVVLDMAVLAQGLGRGIYDYVVTVEAPAEIRVARLVARGMSMDDALARINSQTSEEHRRNMADIVVVNDGSVEDLHDAADAVLAL